MAAPGIARCGPVRYTASFVQPPTGQPYRFERTPLSKIRPDLSSMSSQELLELHAEVVEAIKAAIRAKRLAADPATKTAEAKAPVKSVGDLERERDEWLAKRGRKS